MNSARCALRILALLAVAVPGPPGLAAEPLPLKRAVN